jgi:Protein of unknown function (DUF2782)
MNKRTWRQSIVSAVVVFGVGSVAAQSVFAQSAARPRPQDAQPVEEPLPPAKIKDEVAPDEKVTVVKKGKDRVEEFRSKGKLYKMRVTPAAGPAYTLIDEKGDGNFVRVDGPVPRVSVPMWVLLEW